MNHPRLALTLVSLVLLTACASNVAQTLPSPSPTPFPSLLPSASPSPSLIPTPAASPSPILVTSPRTKTNNFQAGISLLVYGNDVSYQREAAVLFDQLATDNINSLSIVFPIFQSSYYATDIHTSPVQTPSNTELAWLVAAAKARGFSVMLRPLIDEPSLHAPYGGWRGGIRPSSPTAWFVSYDSVLVAYAHFAQTHGVFALDIGSELETMERYTYEWSSLISRLRSVYSGALTYSSNFESSPILFGYLLDFIGVDAYYTVSKSADPSVNQIVAGWRVHGLPDMLYRSALAGRPVVVTEVGVWPANGVYNKPFGGSSSPYNPLAQQKFYAGTCTALKASVSGIYWWYVGLTQKPLPPKSSGHDPLSSPGTDQVIASCYAPPFVYPPAPHPSPSPLPLHHMQNE